MEECCKYEYVHSGLIDDELKCAICHYPFQLPVTTNICGHTFCRKCIETWLASESSCPVCRRRVYCTDFAPIVMLALLNQLNRLRVRCIACGLSNIQRGNFEDHLKMCTHHTVPCPATDLGCSWIGKGHELSQHERTCSFRNARVTVDELLTQKRQLQTTVQRQAETIRLMTLLMNNGKPMTENCMRDDACRVFYYSPNANEEPRCAMCLQSVRHINICMHHCDGGCVCKSCFKIHYPT